MGKTIITDAQSLFAALDHRGENPEEFDTDVWAQCGTEATILVTDLSGFTEATKSHGILHFLGMFRRFQTACVPLIGKNNGTLLKQEADDVFGLFNNPEDAISAGLEMLSMIETLNEGSEPKDVLGLSLGVDYGRLIRLSDDAYGDPVNVAFKLGEDIAGRGELRVGAAAYEKAKDNGYKFECAVSGPTTEEASRVPLKHYILTLR